MMTSCYYEDGPIYSIYTKKQRLSQKWTYDRAVINNLDITDKFENLQIEFTKEHDMIWHTYSRDTSINLDTVYVASGRWEFNETDKTKLELYFIDSISLQTEGEVWSIKKLTQKELRLYSKSNSAVTEFRLKSIE